MNSYAARSWRDRTASAYNHVRERTACAYDHVREGTASAYNHIRDRTAFAYSHVNEGSSRILDPMYTSQYASILAPVQLPYSFLLKTHLFNHTVHACHAQHILFMQVHWSIYESYHFMQVICVYSSHTNGSKTTCINPTNAIIINS